MLKYHGGWSFVEAYNLPVVLRRWFLNRLAKQMEEEREQLEKANKGSKGKTYEVGQGPPGTP